METINQIIYYVAGVLNKTNDSVFIEELRQRTKNIATKLIRDDYHNNGASDDYRSTITVEMELVNENEWSDCKILRSKKALPTPVTLKGTSPYLYVGYSDRVNGFPFKGKANDLDNRFTKNTIMYRKINNFLYLYNTTSIKFLTVDTPFVDIEEVIEFNNNGIDCKEGDYILPIRGDMLVTLKRFLIEERSINPNHDDQEVRIEREINGN